MDSTEELQQLEITALKSIYAEDFSEPPPPKVWKYATRQPEFIIKIRHSDPSLASSISINLLVKFPKTYPRLACPIFNIEKPAEGLKDEEVNALSQKINAEAQSYKGSEMVFQIVTFCQEWITDTIARPVEVSDSLAVQMTQRGLEEERAKKEKEAEVAEMELARAERAARELVEEIKEEDAIRQLMAREELYKARRRANSEATEVPLAADTLTETFKTKVHIDGVTFNTVKLFHPRTDAMEVVYMADPMCDDVNITLPLELHVITFTSHYYSIHTGKKKLLQVESEIQQLATSRHPNLLNIFAVKLNLAHSNNHPQLMILTERTPLLTLQDVLEDCESLKEERTSDYLGQILAGLNSVHASEIFHRGISARTICLASRGQPTLSKLVKLSKIGYYTRLLDLHRSNSFGPHIQNIEEPQIPEAWLSKDVRESSLVYTQQRDLHSVGIVLLQMLLGLDVTDRYPDLHAALQSESLPPILANLASQMLIQNRKRPVTCLSLLADLSESSLRNYDPERRSPLLINGFDPKTPMPIHSGSPETDYFQTPATAHLRPTSSRWKDDWEELELLGKGAFGSVVKARNKIDSRVYAVKKVRLKTESNKIFREVNALSRLSHRFIVRYYTTWVETSDSMSTAASDDSSAESTEEGLTSVPDSERQSPGNRVNGGWGIDLRELDDISLSRSSFPSIIFERSSSPGTSGEDSSGDGQIGGLMKPLSPGAIPRTPPPPSKTLYIQMEFVERQTLRERVDEGLSESEAWRLFQQILDALVHMSTLGILHRDIKLTNIFIDANNDCKIGDFGLATSSLAAVDPSDVSPHVYSPEADMTLEVGTRLYIAPEVQSRRRTPRNHSKADMYSLGIVFFEMNYNFSTGSERIAVLEDLRRREIIFPPTWESRRTRQKDIITWLLQHEPDDRPTAVELSQSSLLPPRVEDEHFRDALSVMTKPDSPHHQVILSSLFNQPPKLSRAVLYDQDIDPPEHTSLNDIVQERLAAIFRLHGAVNQEPPLFMPVMDIEEAKNQATFIDKRGDVVVLPSDIIVPFARLAARANIKRIKRYHIASVFKPNPISGHPKMQKAAILDIITQDLESGPIAAVAEIIAVANACLNSFPNLLQTYDIHISHSKIIDHTLSRVPVGLRSAVIEIMNQSKTSAAQRRTLLVRKGLLRSTTDELEILSEIDDDLDNILIKLEKVAPNLLAVLQPFFEELKNVVQYATSAGATKPIYFHPLMLGYHHAHYNDGVLVEVVRKNRPLDVLAAGGRYDTLISRYSPAKQKPDPHCAVGIQIDFEKIAIALAAYQTTSVKNLVKEERSFGFWSPRRCDVYVISYQPGYLQDRLEVVSYLWQHNISADIMYESGLPDVEHENYSDLCMREGILFTVYPRPRPGRRDHPAFKVKSILKGTEYELSRQELVGWLQHQIAEQKRIDVGTSGAPVLVNSPHSSLTTKEAPVASDVQLVLPPDMKKQRKHSKQLYLDRAFEVGAEIKASMHNGMPTIAVDVSASVFNSMVNNPSWITEEEPWKNIIPGFPSSAYAQQVREAVLKKKAENHAFVLLFAVRDSRVQLLRL